MITEHMRISQYCSVTVLYLIIVRFAIEKSHLSKNRDFAQQKGGIIVFYEQLIKICSIKNVKPSPVLKELGLSSGNLKRWESGASVNYDTLEKLAEYFDVPVDYFFENDDTPELINVIDEVDSFKSVFNIMKAHPDYIASLVSGRTLSAHDLSRISAYLNCSSDYLVKGNVVDVETTGTDVISPKDMILNILSKTPSNDEYRYLQVRISTIIISNLAKKNITMENLLDTKLAKKKVRNLYDLAMPTEKKKGLNFSDLVRISEAFNVSYDYMLTGNGE